MYSIEYSNRFKKSYHQAKKKEDLTLAFSTTW